MKRLLAFLMTGTVLTLWACDPGQTPEPRNEPEPKDEAAVKLEEMKKRRQIAQCRGEITALTKATENFKAAWGQYPQDGTGISEGRTDRGSGWLYESLDGDG